MATWKTIKDLRNNFIKMYTESYVDNTLEKACTEEKELMDDYNGRQILELLQNVDDAYREKKENSVDDLNENVEVNITFKNNILSIGNTGTAFTSDTISRLCIGRASSKSSKNIGNKGTGFRSLLNDAEWIELYSGKFSIRFSESFTKQCFKKHKNIEIIKRQENSWKKEYPLSFPIMNCPESIETIDHQYDTLIRIKIKHENSHKGSSSIENQLEQPFYKSLLFLPFINQISIETNQSSLVNKKVWKDDKTVEIIRLNKGELVSTEKYLIFDKRVEVMGKLAELIIAVPLNENYNFSREKMYCYFPIRNVSTPIDALIHAPFKTNNSRDNIPQDSRNINSNLFEEIIVFIREIAEDISKMDFGSLAIKTVNLKENYSLWNEDGFNIRHRYLDELVNAKILMTVNDEYISINDSPKLIRSSYPETFQGEMFNQLLKYNNSTTLNKFIEELADFIDYDNLEYKSSELKLAIDRTIDNLSIVELIEIFIWWSNHYRNHYEIPKVLRDSNGRVISKDDIVFLPTQTGISKAPTDLPWVNLCILDPAFLDEIIKQLESNYPERWEKIKGHYRSSQQTSSRRILGRFSTTYLAHEFREQTSSEQMIRVINNQIDDVNKSISFITWFFKEYWDILEEDSELASLVFNLPSSQDSVMDKTNLYLGAEYGSPISNKLFQGTNYVSMMDLNDYVENNRKDEFINFLLKCGVKKYPSIKLTKMKDYYGGTVSFKSGFVQSIKKKYPEINFYVNYLTSVKIEHFDTLVNELTTEEIKNWVRMDQQFLALLYSDKQESYVRQQSNGRTVYFSSSEYVKFVLNNSKWIEINDKHYSPIDIVTYESLGNYIDGLIGIKEHELIDIVGKALYENLDFRSDLASFNDRQIFKILKEIPKTNASRVVSRKLYRDIIISKSDITPDYDSSSLEVLCKDGDFYPIEKVRYADKRIPKSLTSKIKFIHIQEKLSTTTIKNWFGVDRYKSNLKYESHIDSFINLKEFNSEINDIKVSVQSTIDDNKNNIRNIKNLNIVPCQNVVAIDLEQGNKKVSLDDFYFVEDDKNYYLKIPQSITSVNKLRNHPSFSMVIVDLLKPLLNLALKENLIELLVSRDSDLKKQKISNDFGVDRWNEAYEHIFGSNPLNKMVIDYFEASGCEGDILNAVKEIDYTSRLSDAKVVEKIIILLKAINKDIIDINNLSELLHLDISDYWLMKLRELKESKQFEYENKLFYTLLSSDETKKLEYLKLVDIYYNFEFQLKDVKNSIHCNPVEIINDMYGIFKIEEPKINYKEVYDRNYEVLNPENKFPYDIDNDYNAKTFIYFRMIEKFKEWIEEKVKEEIDESYDNDTEIYSKLNGVIPEKKEIEYEKHQSHIEPKTKRGTYNKKEHDKSNRNKKIKGNKGELLIYNMLVDLYGKENIEPKSEAFIELGILKPGQATSGDYDIFYKDQNGNPFFAEVKTSDANEFILSLGEWSFAKKYPDKFKLFVVIELDTDKPKFLELPFRFWEDSTRYNLNPIIERVKVTF